MKKILAFIFSLAFVYTAMAGTLVDPTSNIGVVAWEYVDSATNVYRPGVNDSVLGVDTSVLFSKVRYAPGCIYALITKDSVGAADTIAIEYVTYKSAANGSWIEVATGLCDTIVPVATAGFFYRTSSIPVGRTTWGTHFTIRAVGWIAAKIAKVRRAYLIKGVPIKGQYAVPYPR